MTSVKFIQESPRSHPCGLFIVAKPDCVSFVLSVSESAARFDEQLLETEPEAEEVCCAWQFPKYLYNISIQIRYRFQ